MSVRVMAVVWTWPLPSSEKLVALKLADCADDDGGNSYPAVMTIATVCGLSRRGAQTILRKLETRGCIEVQAAAGTPSRRATVTYRVRLEAVVTKSDAPPVEGRTTCAGAQPVRGAPDALEGRTTCAGGAKLVRRGGARGAPDPSVIRPGSVPEHTHRARDPRFTAVLAIYPRKDREVAAWKAWETLNPSDELAAFILAHVRMRLRASWQDTPARFVPMLVTFLEERRWEDREATAAASPDAQPTTDWFEECKRLHQLTCGERLHHYLRMQRDTGGVS